MRLLETQMLNVAGEGKREATLKLCPSSGRKLLSIEKIEVRGPQPAPEIKWKIEEENVVRFFFDPPLAKYNGTNGYTLAITLGVE